MPIIRTTWFFERGKYGWTENLHVIPADFYTAGQAVNALAPLRKGLLASDATLLGVRISDDAVFRDSAFLQTSPIYGPGTWAGLSDPAFTALLLRFDATASTRKNLYLRGIADSLVEGGLFDNPPAWATRWNDYRNKLTDGSWGIKRLSRTANPPNTILSVNDAGLVSCVSAHGLVPGDRVHITGLRVKPKLPQSVLVNTVPSNFTFTILEWGTRPLTIGPARMIKYIFEVVPITAGIWERIVKKSTGRPFDTPRGRRRRVA